jgi:hypothetical protein
MNYWVDVGIGISFVLSAISGLVFLLPVDPGVNALGVGYSIWSDLHTWSSVAMILGVGAHLVLHWRSILMMTKKMILPERPSRQAADGSTSGVTRRQFLSFGLATLLAGVAAVGCSALLEKRTNSGSDDEVADPSLGGLEQPLQPDTETPQTDESETSSQETDETPSEGAEQPANQGDDSMVEEAKPTQQLDGVACHHGIVNDPFPGRCRHYTDKDGDGFCDYSVPGSGNN